MVNIEVKSTGESWFCLLILEFGQALAVLERFKQILGDMRALTHCQDVVSCYVFHYSPQ
jgi:hypothetical protein